VCILDAPPTEEGGCKRTEMREIDGWKMEDSMIDLTSDCDRA